MPSIPHRPSAAAIVLAALASLAVPPVAAVAQTVEVTPLAPLGAGPAAADAAPAVEAGLMPDGLPVRLRMPRARKALTPGLEAAEAVTGDIARDEVAAAQARAVTPAEPVAEPPGMPKVKSPLATVGARIGAALDAVGSPIKPDRIKIYADTKTVTIPVPKD